jgi:hypothetical protein
VQSRVPGHEIVGSVPAQVSPVDELLAALDHLSPAVSIQRIRLTWPADDDSLWFVRTAARGNDVQFECHPGGEPPFVVEGGDGEWIEAASVIEALAAIRRLLGIVR